MGFASPNSTCSRAGATPEVTTGTKRVCGGQRATHTGVAPALFMTPRAVLCRPRLLVEVVVFATGYQRQSADRSADRIPDQTNYGNGPLIRHVFISCWRHSAKVSEEPMVSSQQLSCERARQSSSVAHCVENSPSPCCCQWRNRASYFGPRNSLNSSLRWSSWRLSNEAVCRRSNRSRS